MERCESERRVEWLTIGRLGSLPDERATRKMRVGDGISWYLFDAREAVQRVCGDQPVLVLLVVHVVACHGRAAVGSSDLGRSDQRNKASKLTRWNVGLIHESH